MIYLITFGVSTLFSFISYKPRENSLNNTNEKRIFFGVLAVLMVSFLAGVRAETVGTDVLVYGNIVFNNVKDALNIFSYYENAISIYRLEPLYILINFLAARITEEPAFFYFLLSLIINSSFFISIELIKDKLNPTITWLSYLLIFYSHTLNMMRQSLAISLMVLCMSLLFRKKIKMSLLFLLLSLLSHYSTGLIAVSLVIIYVLFEYIEKKATLMYILVITSLVFFVSIVPLSKIFLEIGILPERYSIYLEGFSGVGLSLNSIILKVPGLVLFLYKFRERKNKDTLFYFYFLMLILDFLFYQLRITNIVFARISYYFGVFQIYSIPYILNEYFYSMRQKKYIVVLYLFFLLGVWYYQIIISGVNEIHPYISIFK